MRRAKIRPLHKEILDEIEAYLAASGMSPIALGRAAKVGNSFVYDLRKDPPPAYPRTSTIDRLREYMRANPPKRTKNATQEKG